MGATAALVALAIAGALLSGGGANGGGQAEPSVRTVRPASLDLGYPEEVEIEAVNLPPGKVWYVLQPEGVEH